MDLKTHYCKNPSSFPLEKFHQKGRGKGKLVLIVGESPAPNGWRISGKACYDTQGKILASGKRLNLLLSQIGPSVETCGFTELSKCYIGKDRKMLNQCCTGCWPIFVKQIASSDYKLILILGVKTLEIFNKLCDVELITGSISEILINKKKYKVLGIFHPSPINPHGQKKNQEIFNNLKEKLLHYI